MVALFHLVNSFLQGFRFLPWFSVLYAVGFGFSLYWSITQKVKLMRLALMFVTNFSVFTISWCLGFNTGFYLFFFVGPLLIYIMNSETKLTQSLILSSSYLANFALMSALHHTGNFGPLESPSAWRPEAWLHLNMFLAIMMFMFLFHSFAIVNKNAWEDKFNLLIQKGKIEQQAHDQVRRNHEMLNELKRLNDTYTQLQSFNHIISHNLRGPIVRAYGLLDLLDASKQADEQNSQYQKYLRECIRNMDEVIKDLTHILMHRDLRNKIQEYITIEPLIEATLVDVRLEYQNLPIEVTYTVEPGLRYFGIKSVIKSILYNLISNAFKYSDAAKETQWLKIEAKSGFEKLILTIQDNGIGMDLDQNSEKLYQLYQRFTEQGSGKGMGLYLVKSHIDLLSASIQIKSSPGNGTLFTIHLPLKSPGGNII
jgi:signal transduction histidine kinase